MLQQSEPLRVFVAMPGTDMGTNSPWKNIEEVKEYFYKPICEGLQEKLKREVLLVIEKDKPDGAIIHDSMFADSWNSEVFIADLSGNNANVYLELGVRWAVKDTVTIVVTQKVQDILFNADLVRAIEYSQSPTELTKSIEKVILAIISGLDNPDTCLSPVRRSGKLRTISTANYNSLIEEIDDLKSLRGTDLLAAAVASDRPSDRLHLLKKCVEVNPASLDGWLKLGKEYRLQEDYDNSLTALKSALQLDYNVAETHRQLGVTYTKKNQLNEAIHSFGKAIEITDKDPETWSNLGGALRRLGMSKLPTNSGWDELNSAKESYEKAAELDEYNTYALMNAAKLTLLLSKENPEYKSESIVKFKHVLPLCQFQVKRKPKDYWVRFDLADAHLLGSSEKEGLDHYKAAVELIPLAHRKSVLNSVIDPLEDLLQLAVVEGNTAKAVSSVVKMLQESFHQE